MNRFSWNYIKEKWHHAGFQKYFKNMGWMFIGRIFILVIAFFLNTYVARYLGPANYGLLNYTFSFVGLFSFLASLGIDAVLNREIIKDHDRKDQIIGTSFFLKFTGSLLAIAAIIITAFLTTKEPILLGLISMYSFVFIFNAFGVIDTYFQSQAKSKYSTIVMMFAGVVSTILKIVVIALGAGVIWLVAIYTLESILSTLGMIYFFLSQGHSFRKWRFDVGIAKKILGDSWPLIFSSIAVMIYMDIDQIMIKNMMSNEALGIYSVAVKLSEAWYFIPGVIVGSLIPAIVNAKKVSKELYEKRLIKLYSLIFWLSSGIAAITTIFAHFIINLLFGIKFIGATTSLQIYVWAGVAVSLGFVLGQYLLAENYTRISAVTTILGAAMNVLLNLLLIPKFGINGAAVATVISYTIATFSILIFNKTRPHIKIIFKGITLQNN